MPISMLSSTTIPVSTSNPASSSMTAVMDANKPSGAAAMHSARSANRVAETAVYLSAREVHARLLQSLADMVNAEKSAFLWFTKIYEHKFFREFGYASIQAYAAEELGFTPNRTNRYLKLIADLEDLPLIRNALEHVGLGWTKAQLIAKVSSQATEAQWLKAARRLGRRDLEAKVDKARKQSIARRKSDSKQPNLIPCNQTGNHPNAGHDDDGGHDRSQGDSSDDGNHDQSHSSASEGFWSSRNPGDEKPLIDDGPVSIGFRLTPVELARHEAQIEQIRKLGVVNPGATRSQILLAAFDELIASASDLSHDASRSAENIVRRRTAASGYQIVIYKCEVCRGAALQTGRGTKAVDPIQLAAVECDAVIIKTGKRNRSTIAPSVRREVLMRDRFRCRAPGCGNTRFLEIHHVTHRANGGTNTADNLITMCSSCHRLWHERDLGGEVVGKPRD